jgi:hypothetical protein
MTESEGYPTVVVVWADAHSGAEHWAELDADDKSEYLVKSCGFIIETERGGKPEHITLAQSYTPDLDFDHVLHIPKGMVRHIQFMEAFTKRLSV